MNYKQIYNRLIERAKNRQIDGYLERHHIIPRCLGGSDDLSNLVRLTPEEHYIAHLLLIKIHPSNHRLISAAIMMIPNRPSNKLYGWLRRKFSITQSISQAGEKNSQFGTKWVHNKELKVSKKIPVSDLIPDGWEIGRIIDWENSIKLTLPMYNSCLECSKLKNAMQKFCSRSCSKKYNNKLKDTLFKEHLDSMIDDYKKGVSIYQCLVSRNMCGTGLNHTKLKKEIFNRGLAKWEGNGF